MSLGKKELRKWEAATISKIIERTLRQRNKSATYWVLKRQQKRGCQMKLGRMGTRGTEIWIQWANRNQVYWERWVLNTMSKPEELWQVTEEAIMKHFLTPKSHYKTSLQTISVFSVLILTCLQVLPQSEVMYISSLYSTSWDPRLPEEKIHTEYLHINTKRERVSLIFFLTWGDAAISSLCFILGEEEEETWASYI